MVKRQEKDNENLKETTVITIALQFSTCTSSCHSAEYTYCIAWKGLWINFHIGISTGTRVRNLIHRLTRDQASATESRRRQQPKKLNAVVIGSHLFRHRTLNGAQRLLRDFIITLWSVLVSFKFGCREICVHVRIVRCSVRYSAVNVGHNGT